MAGQHRNERVAMRYGYAVNRCTLRELAPFTLRCLDGFEARAGAVMGAREDQATAKTGVGGWRDSERGGLERF